MESSDAAHSFAFWPASSSVSAKSKAVRYISNLPSFHNRTRYSMRSDILPPFRKRRETLPLKFPDDFFGREFGFRLGRKIIRGHEAGCRLAQDETAGLPIRGYGRAPISRPALVSHNRKLRYLGHIVSVKDPAPATPRCQRRSFQCLRHLPHLDQSGTHRTSRHPLS